MATVSTTVVSAEAGTSFASERAHELAMSEVESHLRAGRDVVFDSTGTTDGIRHRALDVARSASARCVLTYLDTPLSVCIERNEQRRDPVPVGVVTELWHRARQSASDARREPFDGINVIDTTPKGGDVTDMTLRVSPGSSFSTETPTRSWAPVIA